MSRVSQSASMRDLKEVAGYRVKRLLGEGTYGLVFEIEGGGLEKPRALKLLKVWEIPEALQSNLKKRFRLEFETGLIKDKNLVQSYSLNEWKGYPFIIMDLCSGGDLRRRLTKGMLDRKDFLHITGGILKGLSALHSNGKIHRDLKPYNILFDEEGDAKLTDFGISGHLNIQLTQLDANQKPQEIFGSYAYMAPEQITPQQRQQTLLPVIDIYAFGVLCYEMLTGSYPFGRWNKVEDMAPYLKRAAMGDMIPDSRLFGIWAMIITKCLRPNPQERFQSVDDILGVLEWDENRPSRDHLKGTELRIMVGEEPGRIYGLTGSNCNKRLIKIGREKGGADNDIRVKEELSAYISRRHATIERFGEDYVLRDGQWSSEVNLWMPSKNGTYINGHRIPYEGMKLHWGDVITIGNSTLKMI